MNAEEELKAKVFGFTAQLSAKTGMELDPAEVWEEVRQRVLMVADGRA